MPGRTCSVCVHEERRQIDALLVARRPYRDISGQFLVSRSALARHARTHLPVELIRAEQARRGEEADELLDDVLRLQLEIQAIRAEAWGEGSLKTALQAVGAEIRLLDLKVQMRSIGALEERLAVLEEMIGGGRRAA